MERIVRAFETSVRLSRWLVAAAMLVLALADRISERHESKSG